MDRSLSDEELDNLVEHLCFTNFAKNPMVNEEISKQFGIFKEDGHFIRKGMAGLGYCNNFFKIKYCINKS